MIGAAILSLLLKVLFSIGVLSFSTGIAQGLVMILAVWLGALGRAHRAVEAHMNLIETRASDPVLREQLGCSPMYGVEAK